MDIINQIDKLLGRTNIEGFLSKSDAKLIIEEIIREFPDDKVFLEIVLHNIEKNWSPSNINLIQNIDRILEYYGIIEGGNHRKSIIEQRGKNIVRKFVTINNILSKI
jgi:hypothetical protein